MIAPAAPSERGVRCTVRGGELAMRKHASIVEEWPTTQRADMLMSELA